MDAGKLCRSKASRVEIIDLRAGQGIPTPPSTGAARPRAAGSARKWRAFPWNGMFSAQLKVMNRSRVARNILLRYQRSWSYYRRLIIDGIHTFNHCLLFVCRDLLKRANIQWHFFRSLTSKLQLMPPTHHASPWRPQHRIHCRHGSSLPCELL